MPDSHDGPTHTRRGRYEAWKRPLPGLPELRVLGRDSPRKSVGLKEHAHPGYEICYIERGTVTWWVGDEIHEVRGGEVFVTWPDEPHGGIDDVLHPCKSYWIELDLPRKTPRGWLGFAPADAREIHRGLASLPRRRFNAPASVARLVDRMFETMHGHSPLRTVATRALLLQLLVEVIDRSRRAASERPISPQIAESLRLMDQNLEYALPVPELARRIGWSTPHFKRQFRAELGTAPADFYLRKRLAAARIEIARSQRSLAQVAAEFGFSSSQYLATCFQRVLGRTPSSYRIRN